MSCIRARIAGTALAAVIAATSFTAVNADDASAAKRDKAAKTVTVKAKVKKGKSHRKAKAAGRKIG